MVVRHSEVGIGGVVEPCERVRGHARQSRLHAWVMRTWRQWSLLEALTTEARQVGVGGLLRVEMRVEGHWVVMLLLIGEGSEARRNVLVLERHPARDGSGFVRRWKDSRCLAHAGISLRRWTQ